MRTEERVAAVRFILSRMAVHMSTATEADFGRLEELSHLLTRAIHDFIEMPYTTPELEARCIKLLDSMAVTV